MGDICKNVIYLQSALGETHSRALDGARRHAAAAGWNLCVVHYAAAQKHGDRAAGVDTAESLREVLANRRPDGCIVEDTKLWGNLAPAMAQARVPYVLFDALSADGPPDPWLRARVRPDNAAAVAAAAKTLFAFNYSDYAFVPHHEALPWNEERELAFAGMAAQVRARFHVYRGNGEESVNVVSPSLSAWLRSLPRPCGVLACNDQTATRVVEAALAAGVRVPDEMPVAGIDDIEEDCENAKVSISSVRLDVEGGAELAAAALGETVRTGRPAAGARFGVLFCVERASTRPLRIPDGRVAAAVEAIRREAETGITAAGIARRVGLPLRTLHRRFLAATGRTPGLELREARFDMARRMLATSRLSVSAIANFCGYDSDSSLRKAFARHGEPPPLRFRARNRG